MHVLNKLLESFHIPRPHSPGYLIMRILGLSRYLSSPYHQRQRKNEGDSEATTLRATEPIFGEACFLLIRRRGGGGGSAFVANCSIDRKRIIFPLPDECATNYPKRRPTAAADAKGHVLISSTTPSTFGTFFGQECKIIAGWQASRWSSELSPVLRVGGGICGD